MFKKVLIHTAFFHEAKPVIEYFKLKCTQTKPYKIYENNDIVLVILGMGAQNTFFLEDSFQKYNIKRAINLGIAGCTDPSIDIGSIFCTTHELDFIKKENLSCFDKAMGPKSLISTTLVDMESSTFLKIAQKYLNPEEIYVLKVVSDHLDTKIPKKEFLWEIMKKNLNEIVKVVTLQD